MSGRSFGRTAGLCLNAAMRQWMVDAFASGPFRGNPACVVEPFEAWPDDGWMQALADQAGLEITVCHFPPGTSKWNKIEHRLFSYITMNWRGRPLVSHQVVVELIAATTTATGLEIEARLDTNVYPTKIKISAQELAKVRLHPHDFHGEWNYTIEPVALRDRRKL